MTNTGQQQAIERFIAYWDEGMAADLAPRLTCGETEAIADLFTACERRDLAAEWINQHSYTDDSGDSHHRSTGQGIRYELATITESVAVVELNEEDPSAFGAGHLVLYRADDKTRRFAITERTDKPEDDDTREVIGWHWCAERYQAGGWTTDAEGETTDDDLSALVEAAWTWATR